MREREEIEKETRLLLEAVHGSDDSNKLISVIFELLLDIREINAELLQELKYKS